MDDELMNTGAKWIGYTGDSIQSQEWYIRGLREQAV